MTLMTEPAAGAPGVQRCLNGRLLADSCPPPATAPQRLATDGQAGGGHLALTASEGAA